MKKSLLVNYIWQLLKELFNVQNVVLYIFAIISLLTTSLSPDVIYVVLPFIFLLANYNLWKKLYKGTIKRPRIKLDLRLIKTNICYLVIKNVGNEDAVNIEIESNPQINLWGEFNLKQITTITANSQLSYFWGSLAEKSSNIRQKFKVQDNLRAIFQSCLS